MDRIPRKPAAMSSQPAPASTIGNRNSGPSWWNSPEPASARKARSRSPPMSKPSAKERKKSKSKESPCSRCPKTAGASRSKSHLPRRVPNSRKPVPSNSGAASNAAKISSLKHGPTASFPRYPAPAQREGTQRVGRGIRRRRSLSPSPAPAQPLARRRTRARHPLAGLRPPRRRAGETRALPGHGGSSHRRSPNGPRTCSTSRWKTAASPPAAASRSCSPACLTSGRAYSYTRRPGRRPSSRR